MDSKNQREMKIKSALAVMFASVFALTFTVGCSTKNYVKSQTAPIIQQTNDLDTKTAADHRNIVDTDERARGSANFAGILMGARPLTANSSWGGGSVPKPHIFGPDSLHDLSRGRRPFANRRRARIAARSA